MKYLKTVNIPRAKLIVNPTKPSTGISKSLGPTSISITKEEPIKRAAMIIAREIWFVISLIWSTRI